MPSTEFNNGPHGRAETDETLIQSLTAKGIDALPTLPTLPEAIGFATAIDFELMPGLELSLDDIGLGINSATDFLSDTEDFSLTKGLNVDSFFNLPSSFPSLGGSTDPFADLNLSLNADDFAAGLGGAASAATGAIGDAAGGVLNGDFPDFDDLSGAASSAAANFIGAIVAPIQVGATGVSHQLDPKDNVLHQYASYTYRITMGAQSIEDHREITDQGFTKGVPKITSMMMQSGGGHAVDGVTRDPIFEEDFFLEDLKMTTIIGANEQGQGSNAVSLTFEIYEPYAVSLIERLLALAEKLKYENYIEIPYVFKIEFIGYDDMGNQIGLVPLTTKYIPFRLTYVKFEIDGRGSRYQCTAIPVNHMTFNQSVEAIPEGVEIAAATVEEFFNGKNTGESGNNTVGSFVHTVNAAMEKMATRSTVDGQKGNTARNAADKIKIVIDSRLNGALTINNYAKLGMLKEGFHGNAHMDPKKPTYGYQPGTSINKIIQEVIQNSTFYTDQIRESDKIAADNAELTAFGTDKEKQQKNPAPQGVKITSRYKMLKYDKKANRHAYEATYIVKPYETSGHQSAYLGRTEIENIAKEYSYLFSGNNQDIIDLNIKFDLAFYNSMAVNLESAKEATPAGNSSEKSGANPGDGKINQDDKIQLVAVEHSRAAPLDNTGSGATEDRIKVKAQSLQRSIMQDSHGDMITIDLSILGDPAFIKQDDILYAPDEENAADTFTDNLSIKQDNGDMYLRLKFKATDDIDHLTGLRYESRQIPNSSFNRVSVFDGLYRIMMIENSFSEGNFTQNLVVVRTHIQDNTTATDDANTDSGAISFGDRTETQFDVMLQDEVARGTSNFNPAADPALRGARLAQDAVDNVTGQAASLVDTAKNTANLTADQAVDEAKNLAGDFYAENTPIDAGEFALVDEEILSGVIPPPSANDIIKNSLDQPINADFFSRRRR